MRLYEDKRLVSAEEERVEIKFEEENFSNFLTQLICWSWSWMHLVIADCSLMGGRFLPSVYYHLSEPRELGLHAA